MTEKLNTLGFDLNRARDIGRKYYGKQEEQEVEPTLNPNPSSQGVNPISIQNHDQYTYFFAGEDEYKLYQDFVKRNFSVKKGNKLEVMSELASPKLEGGLFKASSPIINCAMNMALREANLGKQVVTQAQLEYVFQNNLLGLSSVYSDTGMCLRTDSGDNETHAKSLISQLGANPNLPIYLPVISYDLIKDSNNKLDFKIIDSSKVLYLPILNSPNQSKFNNSDIGLSTGFPIQLNEQGARTFWTRADGLSSCFLDGGSSLGSGDSDLAVSIVGGRVVLAKTC